MNKRLLAGSCIIGICIIAGCASIVSPSYYPITIHSAPGGATVSIIDKRKVEIFTGKTPTAFRLKAGDGYFTRASYRIRISKEGYADRVIPIQFKLNGWYWGNFLGPGAIGMLIVDPITGAMWKIEEHDYFTLFKKDQNGKQLIGAALQVKLLEEVTPQERVAMVQVR